MYIHVLDLNFMFLFFDYLRTLNTFVLVLTLRSYKNVAAIFGFIDVWLRFIEHTCSSHVLRRLFKVSERMSRVTSIDPFFQTLCKTSIPKFKI